MEDGMSDAGWHGKHLTEDEIVADMLARIRAEPGPWRAGWTAARRSISPPG
jgi:hypothetical protein